MTENTADWRSREREAQKRRTMPIWQNESFWVTYAARHADHFVHVSETKPPMLAYTVDETKGARDLQTIIRAGRYLTRYFADVLTAKQIAYYAAWQSNGAKPQGEAGEAELQFARTEEEIIDVYARGPRSCMDGENFSGENSPVRVYAAGDLAVAYLEGEAPPGRPSHDVLARCLVWPEKKVMGRVYPTEGAYSADGWRTSAEHMAAHYALETKLKTLGYQSVYEGASFDGARLHRIRQGGGYVMPYLDNDYGVDDDGDCFIMREEGEGTYACQETSGRLGEEKEPDYDWHCERCGDGQDEDNYSTEVYTSTRSRGTQAWCEHCADNYSFHCAGFDRTYSSNDVDSVDINGSTYSVKYADENFYRSDYSNEYFDPDDDNRVEMHDGEVWAQSEFDDFGFTCEITEENYPNSARHPDHPDVWEGCTDEEINEYLKTEESVE